MAASLQLLQVGKERHQEQSTGFKPYAAQPMAGRRTANASYTDFAGDRNAALAFDRGSPLAVVFQNHGEAFHVIESAIKHGYCSSDGVSVLHIDHHDDLALPGLGIDSLAPGGCEDVVNEDDCPVANDNFLLGVHVLTAAIKRILWIAPPYSAPPVVPPHVCLLGAASAPRHNGHRYMHRSIGAAWWGLENLHAVTCGSTPMNIRPDTPGWHGGMQERAPLDSYEVLEGRSYELAILTPSEALTKRWSRRLLGNSTWFSPKPSAPGAWVLDIDLDYLVTKQEAGAELEDSREFQQALDTEQQQSGKRWPRQDSPSPLMRLHSTALRWLCPLTAHCADIIYEWRKPRPSKRFITRAEVLERLHDVHRVLEQLLPSRPCLITIARSNEGAFTPLNTTLLLEDEVLSMLRSLWPSVSVQYLRSAFGSREQTAILNARLDVMKRRYESKYGWPT